MNKSLFIIFIFLAISLPLSAETIRKNPSFESLIRLMLKQEVNAFFVLENKKTGKYFQFHKVDNNHFEVDLPVVSIEKTAIKRAVTVFKKSGIAKQQVKSKDPKTNKEFKFDTFRGAFSIRDINKAEQLTSDVFTIIHLDSKKNYQPIFGWETHN